MVETHGLTHISLAVRDPQKSLDFYVQLLDVREYYRDDTHTSRIPTATKSNCGMNEAVA